MASELSAARNRLTEPPLRRGSARAALGAGALAAVSAFALCAAVVVSAVQAPGSAPRVAAPAAKPIAAEEQRAG